MATFNICKLAKPDKIIKNKNLSKAYTVPNPQYKMDCQTPRTPVTYITRILLLLRFHIKTIG